MYDAENLAKNQTNDIYKKGNSKKASAVAWHTRE